MAYRVSIFVEKGNFRALAVCSENQAKTQQKLLFHCFHFLAPYTSGERKFMRFEVCLDKPRQNEYKKMNIWIEEKKYEDIERLRYSDQCYMYYTHTKNF